MWPPQHAAYARFVRRHANGLSHVREVAMDRRVAGLLFLGVCVVLAVLLLTRTIGIVASGAIFAIALVLLGSRLRRPGGPT